MPYFRWWDFERLISFHIASVIWLIALLKPVPLGSPAVASTTKRIRETEAETVLKQEGRSADAAKIHRLFNDIVPGDALPIGEAELEGNLANARVRDDKKHIQNPAAPRL